MATMLVTEDLRTEAASVTSQLPTDEALSLVLGEGDTSVEVPSHLAQFLRGIIDAIATNASVTVTMTPEDVTTTVAARMLGISRPTLMKLIREGALPSKKVGTHTRLASRDVLAFLRERDEARREVFDELRVLSEALSLDD